MKKVRRTGKTGKASRKKPRKSVRKSPAAAAPKATTPLATSARGKPRKTLFDLPPLELECMKALWALGEVDADGQGVTVREIREVVAANHRRFAYTTIETIMDRLTRKKVVSRQKRGRAHHYTAVYRLAQARREGVATLLDHFFGGSRRNLQAYLSGHSVVGTAKHTPIQASEVSRTSTQSVQGSRRHQQPSSDIDTSLL